MLRNAINLVKKIVIISYFTKISVINGMENVN